MLIALQWMGKVQHAQFTVKCANVDFISHSCISHPNKEKWETQPSLFASLPTKRYLSSIPKSRLEEVERYLYKHFLIKMIISREINIGSVSYGYNMG